MDFKYKAIDQNNNVVEGVESAENKFDLASFLKKQNLILMEAKDAKKNSFNSNMKKFLTIGSISSQEKITFARNVSAMVDAGLSLSRALNVIEKQSKNKKMKNIVLSINENIKKGSSLSDSLKKHPKVFDNLFISMVKAGEESGNLVGSLGEVANQIEKIYLLKKKIKGAMIYPGVIVTAMVLIGVFMIVFIVPTLTNTFKDIGAQLPISTQIVIFISDFFNKNLLLGTLLVLGFFVFILLSSKTKKGLRIIDFVLLHFPGVSSLVKETNSARTTRTLSSLLGAGVPYLNAIKITKETISNSFYISIIEKAEKNIEMGLPISKIFEENQNYYPAFVSEMVAVGEETGELSPMLLKVAEFYENEVEQKTKNLSTIVEPVLMIIVGAAVGFFAFSMITPMYSLMQNF